MSYQKENSAIINVISNLEYQRISETLDEESQIYILNGSKISELKTFYEQFNLQICKFGRVTNLSNLKDIFQNMIVEDRCEKSVFVWTHVDTMLDGGLNDLIDLSNVLFSMTRELRSRKIFHSNLYVGDGANFK